MIVGGRSHDDAKRLFDKPYSTVGAPAKNQDATTPHTYFPRDQRNSRLATLPDRRATHVPDLYTERELRSCATFHEVLRRGGAQVGLNIRLDGPNGLQIVWAIANPTAPEGWNSGQVAMIRRLLPHIRQFVRVRQALADAEALGASLADRLDDMRIGMICLDWRGMIVEANSRARAILRHRDGLVDRGGFLHARMAADDRRLGNLFVDALPRSGRAATSGSTSVTRSSALPGFALHLRPVDLDDAGFGLGPFAVMVLVVDPRATPSIDPEHVAAALGLTPAESRVAVALAEGKTMRDIAAATHRAESTVRELVKRIHVKLDVSRRAHLVRMVVSLAGSSGSQDSSS